MKTISLLKRFCVSALVSMLPCAVFAAGTINVEIDYMVEEGAGAHSHKPTVSEMEAVKQMFACHGWTLNYVIDDALSHVDVLQYDLPNFEFFNYTGADDRFGEIKADHFDRAGQTNDGAGWHYAIFAHKYEYIRKNASDEWETYVTGSSGLSDGNDDFIVTLGGWTNDIGTPWDRAGTFAHELGHNLGLGHNGGTGGGRYKPNYASIMAYQYQLTGVRRQLQCLGLIDDPNLFKNLDYSNGRLPSINENALIEADGVGIHNVDWDCSGAVAGTVVKELDEVRPPWCAKDITDTTRTVISDANDWANIVNAPGAEPGMTGRNQPEIVPCITFEEVEAMRREMSTLARLQDPANCPSGQPAVVSESCISAEMIWVDASWGGSETGTGDKPYNNLKQAHDAAPDRSILYLQRGATHSNSGVDFNLTKPVTLAGPGTATVDP